MLSLKSLLVAESEGFEPPLGCPKPDFESGAFDHSANSPRVADYTGFRRAAGRRGTLWFSAHWRNTKRNGAAAPFRIVHRERNETFRYFFAGADTAAGVPFPFGAAAIDAGCICAAGTALPLAFMSAK